MEKIIDSGIYCTLCECIIKDQEIAKWECGECTDLSNWHHVDIIIRSKGIEKK